jgi:fructoselysine-6-P-deglycase FrlB-like protein
VTISITRRGQIRLKSQAFTVITLFHGAEKSFVYTNFLIAFAADQREGMATCSGERVDFEMVGEAGFELCRRLGGQANPGARPIRGKPCGASYNGGRSGTRTPDLFRVKEAL